MYQHINLNCGFYRHFYIIVIGKKVCTYIQHIDSMYGKCEIIDLEFRNHYYLLLIRNLGTIITYIGYYYIFISLFR